MLDLSTQGGEGFQFQHGRQHGKRQGVIKQPGPTRDPEVILTDQDARKESPNQRPGLRPRFGRIYLAVLLRSLDFTP